MNVFEKDEVWGADLVEMQEWEKVNKGFRYMLNIIDVFSKYAWSVPLKDKKGQTVTAALDTTVKTSNRTPKFLWVDQGKEFYNKFMDAWLLNNKVHRYSTFGKDKSVVVERFNRTLKERMWKRFTAENTRNWITMLDKLIENYNNTFHSTIGMTPVQASLTPNYEAALGNTLNKTVVVKSGEPKYKIFDRVRISRAKKIFEHGYLPNWSEEVFTIHQIKNTKPVTYILKDELNEVIQGSFYEKELQKTNQDVHRIEKVIRKKKISGIDHALVKWSGYSDKFNQWVPLESTKKLAM